MKSALRDGLDETENALNVKSIVHKDKYTESTPNNQKICLNQVNQIWVKKWNDILLDITKMIALRAELKLEIKMIHQEL